MNILRIVTKVYLGLKFILFITYELVAASLKVAHDIITPRLYSNPGVLAIPLDCKTNLEITMFGNIVSLTPGTLTLEVSEDKKYLYIHAMNIDNIEDLKKSLKQNYEKTILEILR